ncbi:uncharacterized protein [Musca autumnalis]|uniref:uncharacterized protein n=1 Tax=Musca autumnalis TaxID=221902 RepID=UPI003CE98F7F
MYKDMPNTRSKVCCLCCETCLEWSPNLIGDDGECTDVYEKTVKYFDPMVLALQNAYEESPIQSNVLCKFCWKHIQDFHEFQHKVLEKNNQMLNVIKDGELPTTHDNIGEEGVKPEHTQYIVSDEGGGDSNPGIQNSTEVPPLEYPAKAQNKSLNGLFNKVLQQSTNIAEDALSISIKEEQTFEDNASISGDEECASFHDDSISEDSSCFKEAHTKPRKQRKKKDKHDTHPKEPRFNSAEKLKEQDELIANLLPSLECDLCKQNFPNYNMLRLHFTKEHQQKCYVFCCEKKFRRRFMLVEHLRLHLDPETYKCDLCGAICHSSGSLQNHKQFMHEAIKSHECSICQRKFKSKTIMERHTATHATGKKDFKCVDCGRSYAFEFQLKIHASKVHNDPQVCDQCGKTLNGSAALKHHKMVQHTDDGERRKWSCDICNAQLSSNSSLQSHKLSFHNDGTTAFVCKDCGKVAASEKALLQHKKFVHLLEPKYKCTYCEKSFKRNIHLKEHIATHTGESLYQCPHCPQTFKNNANRHKHRKIAHPIEWAKARENRFVAPKVNSDGIKNAILL